VAGSLDEVGQGLSERVKACLALFDQLRAGPIGALLQGTAALTGESRFR
jgi:hypothetical protein